MRVLKASKANELPLSMDFSVKNISCYSYNHREPSQTNHHAYHKQTLPDFAREVLRFENENGKV